MPTPEEIEDLCRELIAARPDGLPLAVAGATREALDAALRRSGYQLVRTERRFHAEVIEIDIEDLPELIEKLRTKFLLEFDAEILDPEAEQLFLLALSSLEQAERFAKLAVYKVRQERARQKGSWP
jgi:hypothetical protein